MAPKSVVALPGEHPGEPGPTNCVGGMTHQQLRGSDEAPVGQQPGTHEAMVPSRQCLGPWDLDATQRERGDLKLTKIKLLPPQENGNSQYKL